MSGNRALLEALLEALDIPHPATVGDSEVHAAILLNRVMHARVSLKGVLHMGDDPGWAADYLRERLAEHPPTGYRAAGTPAAPSCGKCRKPFDPADTRHDGAAQYGLTPYCRRCIDQCADGGAEHVCIICDPGRYGAVTR